MTVYWRVDEEPQQVAQKLLRQCTSSFTSAQIDYLTQSLTYFRDICLHWFIKEPRKFKVRIVATRGPTGTKCPQWHLDHVAVRWIQSLQGRGCQFVRGTNGVNWNVINRLNDDDEDGAVLSYLQDMNRRNRALVDPNDAIIYDATQYEAVLLVGNRWSDFANDGSYIKPAVHKSPAPIPIWEGRVLLTQDVIFSEDDF